jgi:hypothetical protein
MTRFAVEMAAIRAKAVATGPDGQKLRRAAQDVRLSGGLSFSVSRPAFNSSPTLDIGRDRANECSRTGRDIASARPSLYFRFFKKFTSTTSSLISLAVDGPSDHPT